MTGIIPKNKIKGADICSMHNYTYIIRSDLGCYMRSSNINQGSDLTIFNLHPACQNGDHYIGVESGYFIVIKGKSYRFVMDLSADSAAHVNSIHPDFQGGDHYFAVNFTFYIVFKERGTLISTEDLSQNCNATQETLHPNYSNGLYYWSFKKSFSFLKPASEWGVEYYEGAELNGGGAVFSVHPDVLNFLPGGLSITEGPAFGRWENIKTISNDSNTPVSWHKKIVKKVGYNKQKMKQLTHNWNFGVSSTIESGTLASLIAKFQFTFSAEYGGSNVDTESETWDEATEVEEQLSFELKPGERLYLWQYQLGLGKEPVLFCRDTKIDDEPNPPKEIPLPPAKS